jgi:chromate reductase
MGNKKTLLVIVGSASSNSANLKLVETIADLTSNEFYLTIYKDLKILPHFDPEVSANNPPEEISKFRRSIEEADGVIICTPEYIFSIPSGLKNAIEWCISTTIFTDKPVGLITASANGQKGHEELQLVMKTAMAKFTNETCLLIQGIKGKLDAEGKLIDNETKNELNKFISAFKKLINTTQGF